MPENRPTVEASTAEHPRNLTTPRRRPRAFWAVGILLAIGAVGGLAWIASRSGWRFTEASLARVDELIEAKRYDEAASEARAFLAEHPDDSIALFGLARAEAGAEDFEEAVSTLRRIPDWSRLKPDARFFEGKALMRLGRAREAERAYLDAGASASPMAPTALMELFALYGMEERFDDFRRVFWRVFPRLGPSDRVPVLAMRMRTEFEQVKPEINAESLGKIVEADPSDPQALAGLGATASHANDLETAASYYKQALAKAPGDLGIRARYLDVLHRLGDSKTLDEVLDHRPAGADSDGEMLKYLGIRAQRDGDSEAAAEFLGRARDLLPLDAEIRHRLSQVETLRGRPAEAAVEAAARDRLNAARVELRRAWDEFADTLDREPEAVTPEQLRAIADGAEAAGLTREAEAWRVEAERLESDPN